MGEATRPSSSQSTWRVGNDLTRIAVIGAVLRPSAIGQWADRFRKFEDRTRPTMAEQNWQRILMLRSNVKEMDTKPIYLCVVLSESVDHCLATAPVIAGSPVFRQRLYARQRHALRPVSNCLAVWPAPCFQTALEVIERALRHVEVEGSDR
jgi:hypothetical protein